MGSWASRDVTTRDCIIGGALALDWIQVCALALVGASNGTLVPYLILKWGLGARLGIMWSIGAIFGIIWDFGVPEDLFSCS